MAFNYDFFKMSFEIVSYNYPLDDLDTAQSDQIIGTTTDDLNLLQGILQDLDLGTLQSVCLCPRTGMIILSSPPSSSSNKKALNSDFSNYVHKEKEFDLISSSIIAHLLASQHLTV